MPAIVSDRDPICLQYLKIFQNLQSDRVGLKSHVKFFFVIAGILLGPYQIRLQAYMVPNVTEIAGIFGPYQKQNCWHKWSPRYDISYCMTNSLN